MKAVVGIGDQQHVGFVNRLPAANRAAVKAEAVLEGVFFQFADRVADVLPEAGKIGEAKIENFCVVFCGEFKNCFRVHSFSLENEVDVE